MPHRPDQLWGPPCLLAIGLRKYFLWSTNAHCHQVSRPRMSGTLYPSLCTYSWFSVFSRGKFSVFFIKIHELKRGHCYAWETRDVQRMMTQKIKIARESHLPHLKMIRQLLVQTPNSFFVFYKGFCRLFRLVHLLPCRPRSFFPLVDSAGLFCQSSIFHASHIIIPFS